MAIRYSLLKKLGVDNDIEIFDLLSINWGDFKFGLNIRYHIVTKPETQKPHLISIFEYGSATYLDFILLINDIENPFELQTEMILKIPSIEEIKSFILEFRK